MKRNTATAAECQSAEIEGDVGSQPRHSSPKKCQWNKQRYSACRYGKEQKHHYGEDAPLSQTGNQQIPDECFLVELGRDVEQSGSDQHVFDTGLDAKKHGSPSNDIP